MSIGYTTLEFIWFTTFECVGYTIKWYSRFKQNTRKRTEKSMDNKYFLEALHNFTMDVACRDAINHLTDKGMTVDEISEQLTYPASKEFIEKVRNERLCENRRLHSPCEGDEPLYEIVEEYDSYGRKSFRRVPKKP